MLKEGEYKILTGANVKWESDQHYVATDADGMIDDIDDADSLKVIYRYQKVICFNNPS